MTARDDNELSEIRQALADRADALFERLYDKPSKVRGNQRRWGRKGSLVLYMRGRGGPHWHCYETRQGGDMLAAIQHALNTPQLRISLEMFAVEGDGRLPGSEGVSGEAGENMDPGVHG